MLALPGVATVPPMVGFLIFLLVLWLVVSVIGAIIEGLLWLTLIGIILFVGTGVFLWLRAKARGSGTTTTR